MIILGIETSCDETGVALVECAGGAEAPSFQLLGSALHSQIETHAQYGGVYPMLAKREHIKNLPIVLEQALKNADKTMEDVDQIAVTVGPGLEPALWTGINFAQELSERYGKPMIAANHMEGHISSVLLKRSENPKSEIRSTKQIQFPAVALLVSGGHTELIYLESWHEKKLLGQTKDDAAGEAFDKVARMLGLPYPGGPQISALADKARSTKSEIRNIKFPRPMINSEDYDFSFSGLKTAVLYYIKKATSGEVLLDDGHKAEIAMEFEDAVTDVLVSKTRKALEEYAPKSLILGGGVAANQRIRQALAELAQDTAIHLVIPDKELATDNAVMIAMAGYLSYLTGKTAPAMKAKGNLKVC